MTARTNNGSEFEARVAQAYQALGYHVEPNVDIAGQQVDMMVEKIEAGAGRRRYVVECKFLSSGSVSNQIVQDTSNMFDLIRVPARAAGIVLVSSRGFSPKARAAAASNPSMTLATIVDLEDRFALAIDPMIDMVTQYEASEPASNYVSLSAKIDGVPIESAETFLDHWVEQPGGGLATVLGDFGAGKTTLLERIRYLACKRVISGSSTRIPLMVQLKEYWPQESIDAMISSALKREYQQSIPMQDFWNAQRKSRLVLLLDGFDEMLPSASPESRLDSMLTLSVLFGPESKCVLSCRPGYFVSDSELLSAISEANSEFQHSIRRATRVPENRSTIRNRPDELRQQEPNLISDAIRARSVSRLMNRPTLGSAPISFHVVELLEFSEPQILARIRKNEDRIRVACGASPETVYEFLRATYDLQDLMRRPILMDLILDTVMERAIDFTDKSLRLGPSNLYEIYTELKWIREQKKGKVRRFLTKGERREFAHAVALAIYQRAATLEVTYDELTAIVEEKWRGFDDLRKRLRSTTIKEIVTDVQMCAFLKRNSSGVFKFTHKSFYEFFVASYIATCRDIVTQTRMLAGSIPMEILYFLASYCGKDSGFRERVAELTSETARSRNIGAELVSNLAAIWFGSGIEIPSVRLRDAYVTGIPMRGVRLHQCVLENVVIRETRVIGLIGVESTWTACSIRMSDVHEWSETGSSMMIDLQQTTVREIEWKKSNVSISGSKSSRLESALIMEGTTKVSGDVVVDDISCVRANFHANRVQVSNMMSTQSDVTLVDGRLSQCRARGGSVSMEGAELLECDLESTEIRVARGARLLKSRIVNSTIDISDTGVDEVEISECHLEGTTVRSSGFDSDLVLDSDVRMSKCTMIGPRIVLSEWTRDMLVDSNGVIVIDDEGALVDDAGSIRQVRGEIQVFGGVIGLSSNLLRKRGGVGSALGMLEEIKEPLLEESVRLATLFVRGIGGHPGRD